MLSVRKPVTIPGNRVRISARNTVIVSLKILRWLDNNAAAGHVDFAYEVIGERNDELRLVRVANDQIGNRPGAPDVLDHSELFAGLGVDGSETHEIALEVFALPLLRRREILPED